MTSLSRRYDLLGTRSADAYASFRERGSAPDHYSQFNPLAFSLEQSFPLVNLGIKDHWQTSPDSEPVALSLSSPTFTWMRDHCFVLDSPVFLRCWSWAQTVLGWILATLFVAGFTGIVKSA